jgi:hypothetical protein
MKEIGAEVCQQSMTRAPPWLLGVRHLIGCVAAFLKPMEGGPKKKTILKQTSSNGSKFHVNLVQGESR